MMGDGTARPVIIGEVLYDRFEDGSAVLGGAPFNVAWHLQGFGLEPLFISRVGSDSAGAAIYARMLEWGMGVDGLQLDPRHPTGAVKVELSGGEPRYDICTDQAYDYIDADAVHRLLGGVPGALLYHGTLIARRPESRAALAACIDAALPVFVDVNLRAPWWDRSTLLSAVRHARWAKVNEGELTTVLDGVEVRSGHEADAALCLRREFDLEGAIVTLGERGALWAESDGVHQGTPPAQESVVDTVGAGDAFSAVAICGLLRGWSARQTLHRALAFASRLCTVRGATVSDRDFYRAARDQWAHGEADHEH